jgi:FkbM family methyltransferase
MIKCFAEHSLDVSLLNGGVVIDAGCRGFGFSLAMQELGMKVYALDIEDMVASKGINFIKAALTNKRGEVYYVDTEDKQAKYISEEGTKPVKAMTLEDLYLITGEKIDCLKIDIEGSEYDLLSDENFRPVPKQISLEFHRHSLPKKHDKYYQKVMDNLLKYYRIVLHDYYKDHGCDFNFWNSLFVKK